MRRWCVYIHITPSNKVYVGITSQNPIKRWNNGLGYNRQMYFYRAILKYGWDNIRHEIIISGVSGEEAKHLEKYYISLYQANNPDFGYNLTSGGDGTLGFHHSQESRASISIKHTGKKRPKDVVERIASKNRGRKMSEDSKRKMSEAKLNQSFETRQKISNALRGKVRSTSHCLNISKALKGRKNIWNNKAVLQYSKQGVFIKEWNTISEVSRLANISPGNIVACCKGRLKTAGGFIWKYKVICK